ncbi:protein spdB [Streptomyces scopuliridis]|uniref:protein spdB n=1 Tax=Streptomyces scopuliridis TaxID=452529 RepID=UPI00367763E6
MPAQTQFQSTAHEADSSPESRPWAALPAQAMTAVSMVLTVVVVVMWLGEAMPWGVALVVGLGLDGGWLATLAYERRLAAQGDHSAAVTRTGWAFGALATAVLVTHALMESEETMAAWLAVAWLPLAAKALWLVHARWEDTQLTERALGQIRSIRQAARDDAAVARAKLRAEAGTEQTRLEAVTQAGSRVAQVQVETAATLAGAWDALERTHAEDGPRKALTSVTTPVTADRDGVTETTWALPTWGPIEALPAPAEGPPALPAGSGVTELSDDDLDAIVAELRASEVPPLSYRKAAERFRAEGHVASEDRLRASWRRVGDETAAQLQHG